MKCETVFTLQGETFLCPTCGDGFIIPVEQHQMDVDQQSSFQPNTTSQSANSGATQSGRSTTAGRSSRRNNRSNNHPFQGLMQLLDTQMGQGQGGNPMEIFNQIIPPGLATMTGGSSNEPFAGLSNEAGGGIAGFFDEINNQLNNPPPTTSSNPQQQQNASQQGESTQPRTSARRAPVPIRIHAPLLGGSTSGDSTQQGEAPPRGGDGLSGDFIMDLIGRMLGDNNRGGPPFFGGGNIEFIINDGMNFGGNFGGGGLFGRNFGDFVSDGDLGNIEDWLYRNFGNIQGPAPATEESIRGIPVIKVTQQHLDEELQCSVCFENFELDEDVKKLPCNHLYHPQCIDPWLVQHNTCPICRKPAGTDAPRSNRRNRENPQNAQNQSSGTTSSSNQSAANSASSNQNPPNPSVGTSYSFRIVTPSQSPAPSNSSNIPSNSNSQRNIPGNSTTPSNSNIPSNGSSVGNSSPVDGSHSNQTAGTPTLSNNRIRDFFGTFMPFFGNVTGSEHGNADGNHGDDGNQQ